MRTLIVFLMLCGVVMADATQERWAERERRQGMKEQIRKGKLTSHGAIPVKYHEMYGPYQIFQYPARSTIVTFEARFVKLEKGMVFVGIDGEPLAKTKQPQTEIFSLPLKWFDYQGQKAIREEVQRRIKAENEKKILYPEPIKTPEPEAVAAPKAQGGNVPLKRGSLEPPRPKSPNKKS